MQGYHKYILPFVFIYSFLSPTGNTKLPKSGYFITDLEATMYQNQINENINHDNIGNYRISPPSLKPVTKSFSYSFISCEPLTEHDLESAEKGRREKTDKDF